MTSNTSDTAVACTLTEAEADERPEWVARVLRARFERAAERANGYTFVFAESGESLAAVSTFVEHERECCAFAAYTILLEPPYDEVALTVTGPNGTKELLGEGMLEELRDSPGESGEAEAGG